MELTERQARAKKTAEHLGLNTEVKEQFGALFLIITSPRLSRAEDQLYIASRVNEFTGRTGHFAFYGADKIPLNRVGIRMQTLAA